MSAKAILNAAFATVGLTALLVQPAAGVSLQRVIEFVRFCADNAQSRSAISDRAVRQRWWRLDREALRNLQTSTHLASNAEVGWLADEEGVMITMTTQNTRLAALGEPLTPDEKGAPSQACTVYATDVDLEQVRLDLENTLVLGVPLGPPSERLELEARAAQFWTVRSEAGEVAYVYAEFGGTTAIVEVGRVVQAP